MMIVDIGFCDSLSVCDQSCESQLFYYTTDVMTYVVLVLILQDGLFVVLRINLF